MRRGENINGYLVVRDFTTAGGGLSKWSFAEKGGRQFFIKEFLRPTWPLENSPGSKIVKDRKRIECNDFERHHKELMNAISGISAPGGNLISTLDFFRWGTKYYKVTEKVDVTTLKPAQIAALPLNQRLLIMTTVAHSLRILHKVGIVHNDLKLDNVLIKRTRLGSYTSKLIDFDSSFFNGNPPLNSEEVVGDLVFYSPELARYIQGNSGVQPKDLTTQADIFALGLLYCLYLTGSLPPFNREKFRYAWLAVNSGEDLKIQENQHIPSEVKQLLERMIAFKPEERPEIESVFSSLKSFIKAPEVPEELPAANPEPPSEKDDMISSILKSRMGSKKEFNDGDDNPKLKGSLLKGK